jgi:NAD(P)-dependent dehydrogenase (short-subunit alcohol dehydrogenase family)
MKIAVVTGASRGIGRNVALQCARRGWGVVLTYNTHAVGVEEAVAAIAYEGGKAVALHLDVTRLETFRTFRETLHRSVREIWGRETIDYLVNNAGVGGYLPITEVTEPDFDAFLGVHLKGPFFLTQALLPGIENGGAVVNVSSATTRVATPGVAVYAAMKGGLEVMTRYLAREFGDRRIRFNAVAPGAARTDLGGGLDNYPEVEALMASQTALGRVGEPDDIGRAIAALLSDDCAWINAQTVEVAGGYNI